MTGKMFGPMGSSPRVGVCEIVCSDSKAERTCRQSKGSIPSTEAEPPVCFAHSVSATRGGHGLGGDRVGVPV